jgi:hypothetical protein
MRYAEPRQYADTEKAARRIVEISRTIEPVQDGASMSRRSTGSRCREDVPPTARAAAVG